MADLVVVKGDPLKNWDTLANPVLILREGVVVANQL